MERLDPALSRPGRMDVWVEFKNASKWQAELLFRNFFPSTDEEPDPAVLESELEGIDLPDVPQPQSPSMESTSSSALFSSLSSPTDSSLSLPALSTSSSSGSSSGLSSTSGSSRGGKGKVSSAAFAKQQMGAVEDGLKNQAYLPPPVEDEIAACKHSAAPLDSATLAVLAKKFADSIPDEEFSVASLQGCECLCLCFPLVSRRSYIGS